MKSSAFNLTNQNPRLLTWSKNLTDAELVVLYQSGNQDAFTVLLHRYHGLMYAVVRKVIWDEDGAMDAMQDAILKLMEYIQRGMYRFHLRFASHVFYWFRYIALSKISKYHFVSMDDVIQNIISHKYPQPAEQETKLIKKENRNELREQIQKLPKTQRQIIILSEFLKMTYIETANYLNISDSKVEVQKRVAIQQLRVGMGSTYRQPIYDREALGVGKAEEPKANPVRYEQPASRMALAVKRLRDKRLAEQRQRSTAIA